LILLALVAACSTEDPSPTPPNTPVSRPSLSNAAVADDSAWDTLVADVTVNSTRVDSLGRSRSFTPIKYHFERSRQGAGWKTEMTLAPRVRAYTHPGRGAFDPEANEVARIESDDNGSISLFNGHGQKMQLPDHAQLDQAVATLAPSSSTPLPTALRTAKGRGASHGSAWAEEYIAVAGRASQRQAKVAHAWGNQKKAAGSSLVYQHVDGKNRRELRIDPATGLPAQMSVERSDSLREITDYSYDSRPDGSIVHRQTHIERVALLGAKGKTVTDISFDNTHLEKRGRP
jgi:hypothetical protein